MIQFKGGLTGAAEKRFWQKVRKCERIIWIGALAFAAITTGLCTYRTRLFEITVQILITAFVLILLCVWIPKSKKTKEQWIPKSITFNGQDIVAIYAKQKRVFPIAKVKEVQDCKTYYEVVLPFYAIGFPCICQKDQLEQGTLEAFEAMFEGKLTDMTEYFE